MGLLAQLEQAGRPAAEAKAFVERLGLDFRTVALDAPDRAMLEYAHRLTVSPGETGDADVRKLREAGFSDLAIHDICAIVAYYAFVNRIADGLGVRLEDRFGGAAR